MTTQQTTAVERYRRPRGQHPKPRRDLREKPPRKLPEYLEAHEVDALIRAAPYPRARLLFLIEWRAGLRNSEALAVEPRDLSLDTDRPTIRVRRGKGSRARIVPVHAELHTALTSALQFGNIGQGDTLVSASRSTADRWIKEAAARAEELGAIPPGRHISNHTLRHSYAAPSADARHPDQLPQPLAGALVDPDDPDLPGTGAGSDREPGCSAVNIPANIAGLAHTTDVHS